MGRGKQRAESAARGRMAKARRPMRRWKEKLAAAVPRAAHMDRLRTQRRQSSRGSRLWR